MRADLNVQMAKAKAKSAATWSGSELVCAAVQQGKTLNYVVMKLYSRHPQPPRWRPSGYVQRNLGRLRVLKMPTRTDDCISGAKCLIGFATNTHPVQFWLMVWYSIWLPGKPL